jgi:hypothetical protein
MAAGNPPPATSPVAIRMATSKVKSVTMAEASATSAMIRSETFISRVLPNMSASAPRMG